MFNIVFGLLLFPLYLVGWAVGFVCRPMYSGFVSGWTFLAGHLHRQYLGKLEDEFKRQKDSQVQG